jgi:hypothetical protein
MNFVAGSQIGRTICTALRDGAQASKGDEAFRVREHYERRRRLSPSLRFHLSAVEAHDEAQCLVSMVLTSHWCVTRGGSLAARPITRAGRNCRRAVCSDPRRRGAVFLAIGLRRRQMTWGLENVFDEKADDRCVYDLVWFDFRRRLS